MQTQKEPLPKNRQEFRLDDIGFYTLKDARIRTTGPTSPLWRCELLLSNVCNLNCPYCRGIRKDYYEALSFQGAVSIVNSWALSGLKNIRFSGGEPTLWNGLDQLCEHSKRQGIQRIAVSTNGSADSEYYKSLIQCGVNDFSISLDACCSSTASVMTGKAGVWEIITNNIRILSKLTYVTVGIVITQENAKELKRIIEFASLDLGANDIRIIPAAQWNGFFKCPNVGRGILSKHPILRYRINNFHIGRKIRGIETTDNHRCPLVLDDMVVMGRYHFPCIIYLREGGGPIGEFNDMKTVRIERGRWAMHHNTFTDSICRENCLDVCIDYNNKYRELRC